MSYSAEFKERVARDALEFGAVESARRHGVAWRSVYEWAAQLGLDVRGHGAPDHIPGLHLDGTIDVFCWCETKVVQVSSASLRAGQMGSCGRPWCQRPTPKAA